TITKGAITQHQENKQKLIAAIDYVFEEGNDAKSEEKDRELSLLSTILKKLYQGHKGKEMYLSGTPSYERIEGLGAIYNLDIRFGKSNYLFGFTSRSRTAWQDGNLVIIDASADKKNKEAAEKSGVNVDTEYVQFVKAFKESIVDYGSIIKSLKNGEQLIFRLNLPNCEDCETMPERLEIAAKKATLDAYRKEQISLEKAVGELVVK
ncbi:MAG: hypothetical protein AAGJ18_21885, partial [Bacteroidota bacterium]